MAPQPSAADWWRASARIAVPRHVAFSRAGLRTSVRIGYSAHTSLAPKSLGELRVDHALSRDWCQLETWRQCGRAPGATAGHDWQRDCFVRCDGDGQNANGFPGRDAGRAQPDLKLVPGKLSLVARARRRLSCDGRAVAGASRDDSSLPVKSGTRRRPALAGAHSCCRCCRRRCSGIRAAR